MPRRELPMLFSFFCLLFSAVSAVSFVRDIYGPAGVWVILPPLQLRTHHIGQAPGPAGASLHLPKLPAAAGAEEASRWVVFV